MNVSAPLPSVTGNRLYVWKSGYHVFNGGFLDYTNQINLAGWSGMASGLACSIAIFLKLCN